MKNKLLILSLFIVALLTFGCTTSDEEPQIQGLDQDKIFKTDMSKFLNYLKETHSLSDKAQHKGGNNENGVQFVAMYSDFFDDYRIYGTHWIPGTSMLVWGSYPTNGEDEAKVNGDWIMGNWTLQEPRVFIIDYSLETPSVIYSNWCEEEIAGYFHQSSRGKLETHDYDGDGQIDVWRLNPGGEDSDFQAQGRTVLTDGQIYDNWPFFPTLGNCRDATTEVELSWNIRIKNGIWIVNDVLDGVKYSNK